MLFHNVYLQRVIKELNVERQVSFKCKEVSACNTALGSQWPSPSLPTGKLCLTAIPAFPGWYRGGKMQHSDTSPWRCSLPLHARFSTHLTVRFNWAQFSQCSNMTGCRVGIALLSPVPRVEISVQIIKFQFWPPSHWTALKAVGLLRWLLNRTAVIFLTLRADGEHYQMTTLLQGDKDGGTERDEGLGVKHGAEGDGVELRLCCTMLQWAEESRLPRCGFHPSAINEHAESLQLYPWPTLDVAVLLLI